MLHVRVVSIVFVLAVGLSACVTASQSGRDFIQHSLPPGWKQINAQNSGEVGVMEFIPRNQNPYAWTKLMANTFTVLSKINAADRRDKFQALKNFFEKRCPGLVTFNLISDGPTGLLYDRFSKPCLGQPEEHTIGRVFDGKFDRWKIFYSERVARITDDQRKEWIALLKSAKIVTVE